MNFSEIGGWKLRSGLGLIDVRFLEQEERRHGEYKMRRKRSEAFDFNTSKRYSIQVPNAHKRAIEMTAGNPREEKV